MQAPPFGSIFISHAKDDSHCADEIRRWLTISLRGLITIFVSSDWESIRMGDDWYPKVTTAVRDCAVGLVLVTENSVPRPWVNFEIGGLMMLQKPTIPICAGSITPADLPSPLSGAQACDYRKAEDRLTLLKSVAQIVGLPDSFTQLLHENDAKEARPLIIQPTAATPPDFRQAGHGLALEHLFGTRDRWTTVIYTCRGMFTGEACPSAQGSASMEKALLTHIPVDELQTVCTAVNHFMPYAARRNEDDVLHTVICSRTAHEMVSPRSTATATTEGVPHLLERDLIVVGENNFSNLLLHMMEPYVPWRKRVTWVGDEEGEHRRPMVMVEHTSSAQLKVARGQVRTVGEGGAMLSIFPSPFNLRTRIMSLFGCHRSGQFALENWLRSEDLNAVVEAAENFLTGRPRTDTIQIVVDAESRAPGGGVLDLTVPCAALPNLHDEGRPFWTRELSVAGPDTTIEPNPECVRQSPMYDISLVVRLDRHIEAAIRQEVENRVGTNDFYWEDQECDIGFHVTLFEFCTHDDASKNLTDALDAIVHPLGDALRHANGALLPSAGSARLRGIELVNSALISYVDFLPRGKSDTNWLEAVHVWCERSARHVEEQLHVARLFNKRRVPFPAHVTLCRFQREVEAVTAERLRGVSAATRLLDFGTLPLASVQLAVARKRPYRDVTERVTIPLSGQPA
jgi:hypothetical protein